MSKKILVVDDDSHIREVICYALEQAGMQVWEAVDGVDAIKRFQQVNPDLIVLDIMMPEMDGLEVCKEIRKTSETAILFLSSREEEVDRIIGLELGGDDYVTKPFSPRELVARVNAILRRFKNGSANNQKQNDSESTPLQHGLLRLDIESYTAYWEEIIVHLTATEFSLLKTLMKNPNKVYIRDSLMDLAYSPDIVISDRTIDSHIRHIRTKYAKAGGHEVIATVHGVGYKMGPCQ